MPGPLVALAGPDGAGKTTVAGEVEAILRGRGCRRVRRARIRGTHTAAYLLSRLLPRAPCRGRVLHYTRACVPERLLAAWALVEAASLAPKVAAVHAWRAAGWAVVAERSPLDALVWVVTALGWEPLASTGALHAFLAYTSMVRPVVLWAPPDVLASRKPGEARMALETLPYYTALAEALGLPLVDTASCAPRECAEEALELSGAAGGCG